MSQFQLYEDQAEFVHKLRVAVSKGCKSILGVASPAFGKTVVAGYITQEAKAKNPNTSVWFLVHRKNLLRQTDKSFWAAKIEHGLITSGRRQSRLPVQIGTIGTVYSRHKSLTPPRIMFVDEAHLCRGNMFETVINWARENGTLVIGLTGTPKRLDGKALGDLFNEMIEAKSTAWLIEQGRLSNYVAYTTPVKPDLSNVKNAGGDYNKEQLAGAMSKPSIVGDAVAHWKKLANGLRTVCYCVNVKHSKQTAQAFNDAGVPAVHVDGTSTEAEIKDACMGLADGRYLVMTNCELVIEGFDLSAQVGRDCTLECCILLRPTQSVARYLQMVFRAMRKKPNPAVILDHAGCIVKHGLPCEKREWSLHGEAPSKRKKKDDEPDVNVTQCGKCYAVFKSGVDECPMCGAAVERKERKLNEVEGELEQVDMAAVQAERKRARQEQGQANGLRDLIALGKRRGMKNASGWALNVYMARQNKKPSGKDYAEAKIIEASL
nr:DEAD/DEAH box helicase family protein [Alteromonas macleodii]